MKIVGEVLSEVCELHTSSDLVSRDAFDVVVVRLVGAVGDGIDRRDDLGRVPDFQQMAKLELGVFDGVVKYRHDLRVQIVEGQHQPQGVEMYGSRSGDA